MADKLTLSVRIGSVLTTVTGMVCSESALNASQGDGIVQHGSGQGGDKVSRDRFLIHWATTLGNREWRWVERFTGWDRKQLSLLKRLDEDRRIPAAERIQRILGELDEAFRHQPWLPKRCPSCREFYGYDDPYCEECDTMIGCRTMRRRSRFPSGLALRRYIADKLTLGRRGCGGPTITCGQLDWSDERQIQGLVKTDSAVFKEENRYGKKLIELGRRFPECFFVALQYADAATATEESAQSAGQVVGYFDFFLLEAQSLSAESKCRIGRQLHDRRLALPQANDILGSEFVVSAGDARRQGVVDLYVDAFCARRKNRKAVAHALLTEAKQSIENNPQLRDVRVREIATVAVNNTMDSIPRSIGGQTLELSMGECWSFAALMEPRFHTYRTEEKGCRRVVFSMEFEDRYLPRISDVLAAAASRAFKQDLKTMTPTHAAREFSRLVNDGMEAGGVVRETRPKPGPLANVLKAGATGRSRQVKGERRQEP